MRKREQHARATASSIQPCKLYGVREQIHFKIITKVARLATVSVSLENQELFFQGFKVNTEFVTLTSAHTEYRTPCCAVQDKTGNAGYH